MIEPTIPGNEDDRLSALRALGLLDTQPEERFDRLTRLLQHILQVPIALVSLVDSDRQWFKSRQGLDAHETPRDVSFSGHAILGPEIMVVPDATADVRFADNPLVLGDPHIRFYAGVPLTLSSGLCVGTLCAIDRQPRALSEDQMSALRDLAAYVTDELEQGERGGARWDATLVQSTASAIIENSSDAVISKTLDGIITTWNPAAQDLFGYPAEAAIGQPVSMLIPPERLGEERDIIDRLGRGERVDHFETVRVRQDGGRVDVSVTISPISDRTGKIVGASKIVRDISARKSIEAELAERMHELGERVKEQRCLYGVADLAGDNSLTQEEFLGRAVRLLPDAWQHPEHASARIVFESQEYRSGAFDASLAVVMSSPIIVNGVECGAAEVGYVVEAPAADGGPFLHEERLLLDAVAGQLGRALEQMRAEGEARATLRLVNSILDTVLDGVLTIDDRGILLSCNPAGERIFGYSRTELIGQNVRILMPEPYTSEHDRYLARYNATHEPRVIGIGREVIGLRKDGSTFPMDLAVAETSDADRTMFVGIVRDITERKQMERMKSEFVATVSHELRTPLTSIRGALGLLAGKFSDTLPAKALKLLDTANRNSERLILLINDILDLEKVESGALEFDFRATDLMEVAHRSVAAYEDYGRQRSVRLRLSGAPEVTTVLADDHRLEQVFANLISNAVKYSPDGGTVDVVLMNTASSIRVSVRDSGAGIPQAFRSRIFQPFAQADSSDTRQKGGTGLGLSITKAIVERHGGTIDFSSEEGRGTEFFFEIPLSQQQLERTSPIRRPVLLICEADVELGRHLAELLEQDGLDSDLAVSAAAALEMLAGKRYRAMIVDPDLPDMDGPTLIHRVREDDATRDLPVVMVSGHVQEDRLGWNAQALPPVSWLGNPRDRESVRQTISEALDGRFSHRVLHVEDDLDTSQVVEALLEGEGIDYRFVTSLTAAREALAKEHFDLVLLDVNLPDGSGLELLNELTPDTKVIVFSVQELGPLLRQRVTEALVKATTSNERLLAMIRRVIGREAS